VDNDTDNATAAYADYDATEDEDANYDATSAESDATSTAKVEALPQANIIVFNAVALVDTDNVNILTRASMNTIPSKTVPGHAIQSPFLEVSGRPPRLTIVLVLISLFKTGSNTASGVNIRLSQSIAKNYGHDLCKLRYRHGVRLSVVPKRNPTNS
jgi:hypothetical protein